MKKLFFALAFFLLSVGIADITHARDLPGLEKTAQTAGIAQDTKDPTTTVAGIISWALSFVGVIFLILLIYGGFVWMTSAGNDEQIKKAQQIISSAAIGLVIILSAYAITKFIGGAIGV